MGNLHAGHVSLIDTAKEAWEAEHGVDLPALHMSKIRSWLAVKKVDQSKPSLPSSVSGMMEDKAGMGFDEGEEEGGFFLLDGSAGGGPSSNGTWRRQAGGARPLRRPHDAFDVKSDVRAIGWVRQQSRTRGSTATTVGACDSTPRGLTWLGDHYNGI